MKRGQEVLQTTMLFEILVSVMVAGILFWALFNFGDLSFSDEKYIGEDLRQVESFIGSMEGDVEIDYPVPNVRYENGKVTRDEYCQLKIIKKGKEVSYKC